MLGHRRNCPIDSVNLQDNKMISKTGEFDLQRENCGLGSTTSNICHGLVVYCVASCQPEYMKSPLRTELLRKLDRKKQLPQSVTNNLEGHPNLYNEVELQSPIHCLCS